MCSVNKDEPFLTADPGHASNVQLQNPDFTEPDQKPPDCTPESATLRNPTRKYCGMSKRYRQLGESCRDTTTSNKLENWYDGIGDFNKTIYLPDEAEPVQIYCDRSDGGGWIVIQYNPGHAGTSFDKQWQSFEDGFGDANGYWMGLKLMHDLTSVADYELRIDMKDYCDYTMDLEYSRFEVGGPGEKYKLSIPNNFRSYDLYSVSLFSSNGKEFQIASKESIYSASGGWWFTRTALQATNLNGQYYEKSKIHYYCTGFFGIFKSLRCDCVNNEYERGTTNYKLGSFFGSFGAGSGLIRATKMRIRPTLS